MVQLAEKTEQWKKCKKLLICNNVRFSSPSIVLGVKWWITKSYNQCRKGFKYAENAGKPMNVQDLEIIWHM